MNKKIFIPIIFSLSLMGCSAFNSSSLPNDTYRVRVVDESGQRVSDTNIQVQWCNIETGICLMPVNLNENGEASITSKLTSLFVIHLLDVTEGYGYNPNIYYMDDEHREIVINLFRVEEANALFNPSLDNSENNPYLLESEHFYNVTFSDENENKYIGFNAIQGQYRLTSYVANTFNTNMTKVSASGKSGEDFINLNNELPANNTAVDQVNFIVNDNFENPCKAVYEIKVLENIIYPVSILISLQYIS